VPTQGRWGEAMSFVEVGKRMKVSAEYGRRLCHAAIQKLQRAAQEGALMEPAFLF
jgi:DNA-directed RNA polymerase sigma subunit (sigma70/sigma32)